VVVTNENGCSNSSESVYIAVTNIHSAKGNSLYSIFPNPNDGSFVIRLSEEITSDMVELKLYNSSGRLVFSENIHYPQASYEHNVNATDLKSGPYHLLLFDGKKIYNQTSIIQE